MMQTSLPFRAGRAGAVDRPALAQTTDIDAFKDGPDEAKVHTSGFVCPLFIGHFERDAYGERDPSLGSDFCAYSARDGVYGTITLTPLKAAYDPKTALVPEFTEQEGIGGKIIGERTINIGGGATPISVYSRTYETAALETLHYRILSHQRPRSATGRWRRPSNSPRRATTKAARFPERRLHRGAGPSPSSRRRRRARSLTATIIAPPPGDGSA